MEGIDPEVNGIKGGREGRALEQVGHSVIGGGAVGAEFRRQLINLCQVTGCAKKFVLGITINI